MAHLIDITTSRIILIGTVQECRKYKRAHFDQFSVIFFNGERQRG